MRLWRLTRAAYVTAPLFGQGAAIAGGRWNSPGAGPNSPFSAGARTLGGHWVHQARSVALIVPSVVLPAERNVLINPAHPHLRRVRVLPPEPLAFDRRLLR
jgi:RES domain-containing protein